MENLTEEQIEKLKSMKPEELKELMKKQCLFCNISNGNIKTSKVYEDEDVISVLDISPASKGHCLVFLKEHFQFLGEIDDDKIGRLFSVANKISSKVIEKLKANGTNILVANGQGAGQMIPHVVVHVIPRYEDDGLNFKWEGKKINEGDLDKISKEIKVEAEKRKVEEIKEKKKEKVKKFENVRIA